MIEINGAGGHRHYLAPAAVASISKAGASSQWHGIRSHVRKFDGRLIEAIDTVDDIMARLAKNAEAHQ